MSLFTIDNVRIAGISACVPPDEISNLDYKKIPVKERELLIKTIGVEKRRIVDKGVTALDLSVEAARHLISDLGWEKEDILLEIFVTQTRDYYLPSTAVLAQDRLDLPKECMAFDIGLGCSGYVYGLSVAAGMLRSTGLKKGLLLAGDVPSITNSYDDKSTYPLFGDAGTATALELSEDGEPFSFNLASDGAGYDSIIIPDGGARNLISADSMKQKKFGDGISRTNLHLALKGLDVFTFSVREVPGSVRELLNYQSSSIEDYDYFLFHQANRLINETIRKKLKIPEKKAPYSLQNFGNTSSASIPITIVTELREEIISKPLSLFLNGFGVGLSWGSASLKTNKIVCPKLIDYE